MLLEPFKEQKYVYTVSHSQALTCAVFNSVLACHVLFSEVYLLCICRGQDRLTQYVRSQINTGLPSQSIKFIRSVGHMQRVCLQVLTLRLRLYAI